jgi:hypothetical protein
MSGSILSSWKGLGHEWKTEPLGKKSLGRLEWLGNWIGWNW